MVEGRKFLSRLGLLPAPGPGAPDAPGSPDAPGAGQGGGQHLVLTLVISASLLVALALTLVWLNIERTKLAYRERTLQREAAQALDLNAKLQVERDRLRSPHELGRKAERFGLGPAKPGQLRRMEEEGKEKEKEEEKE